MLCDLSPVADFGRCERLARPLTETLEDHDSASSSIPQDHINGSVHHVIACIVTALQSYACWMAVEAMGQCLLSDICLLKQCIVVRCHTILGSPRAG